MEVFATADGLAHQAVLSLALDKRTGDLWVGTMGGFSRISAGRIDTFTQLNSGLSNDIVYGVWRARRFRVDGDRRRRQPPEHSHRTMVAVQRAQHARCTKFGPTPSAPRKTKSTTRSGEAACSNTTQKTEHWKDYNDPDGETEMVLMKDQGLIHEITTSVSYVDKILWVATYFGASRYDGRYWHNFLHERQRPTQQFSQPGQSDRRQSRLVLDRQRSGLLRRDELGGLPSGARHAQA